MLIVTIDIDAACDGKTVGTKRHDLVAPIADGHADRLWLEECIVYLVRLV